MNSSFYVDKITKCIEEVATGQVHDTEMLPVVKVDLKNVLKKNGWNFSWKSYLKMDGRRVYKLVRKDDPTHEIQGLISFEIMDNYIEMHHIENAPHNIGQKKKYAGVCGNMVAFACKISFDLKFEGFVAFTAKTALMDHYSQTLGAEHIFGAQRMAIPTESAKILVNSYYKNYLDGE
ncbi:MAG TPA: hypothetical protein VMR70_13550 [Flavisolibacter sp.]|nr:hypothetical protein [Flavisolibacter sp.]